MDAASDLLAVLKERYPEEVRPNAKPAPMDRILKDGEMTVSDLEDYVWCQLSANEDERAGWRKQFAENPVGCIKEIHSQINGSVLDTLAVQEYSEGDYRKAAGVLKKELKTQQQGMAR